MAARFRCRVNVEVQSEVQMKLLYSKRNSMEEHLADVNPTGRDITERPTDGVATKARQGATCVASLTPIPRLRYMVPDSDPPWRGKFLQMIVDHLHSRGD